MKMTTFLNTGESNSIPDENILIKLLQCPFLGVKRTSFILLKQMYDLKLVKPSVPKTMRQLLEFKLKP